MLQLGHKNWWSLTWGHRHTRCKRRTAKYIVQNVKKISFYVCPLCGNVIQAVGQGAYSCCGISLPVPEAEETDEEHEIQIQKQDNELYVTLEHPMTKDHYISFIAFVSMDTAQLVKLYPEQDAQSRFLQKGHGFVYAYCNRHGLKRFRVTPGSFSR